MPACTYCQEPAGFLRWWHGPCRKAHQAALREIRSAILQVSWSPEKAKAAKFRVGKAAADGRVKPAKLAEVLLGAWKDSVDRALNDHLLTQAEQDTLEALARHFEIPEGETWLWHEQMKQGELMRKIEEGHIPEYQPTHPLPFNFQKSEKLVWVFPGTDYYKQTTKRRFEGGSRGVSVRVAKGVYLRAGAFKGQSISETEDEYIDTGTLAFTTKHLWFHSDSHRFRVRWDKIIAFDPLDDGLGIQRDRARAKPESFLTGMGWFTCNLAARLAAHME